MQDWKLRYVFLHGKQVKTNKIQVWGTELY